MGPKYEFTDETTNYCGHLLHRIRRLEDGVLGGWVESEDNLSQEGNCWVYYGAMVYDNAWVYGNAQVYAGAQVYDRANVYGNAQVYACAEVFGDAQVYDNAVVEDETLVYDKAQVYGNAKIYDAQVYDKAQVYDDAKVYYDAKVYNEARVYGNAYITDKAEVYGNAIVRGDARICGDTKVCDEIIGEDNSDNEQSTEVVHDFIYKVDDSDKLDTQTEYDSIDEFFSEPITNDIELDTLIICTVDTKEPLIKLQKVETDNRTEFKFIVDIIDEDGDNFIFKSVIKSRDQLNRLIQQTVEALKNYSKFGKYADDLEKNCL